MSTIREKTSEEQGPAVMVIDDDPTAAEGLSLLLAERGLRVRTFTSALEALEAMRGGYRPALVLTDYRMPEMNGLAFVESMRSLLEGVPIILITAHGGVDTYLRSMNLGVFEYVNKPVSIAELERIAAMALGHPLPKSRARTSGRNESPRQQGA